MTAKIRYRMKKKTILLVEDNAFNMKLVRSLLQIGGFNCLEAETAEIGLELARKHLPEMILMDIQLPGMDGLTAAKIIKSDQIIKHIPILALTAYAMKGDEKKVKESGCNGYITKPIDTRAFLTLLESYFPGEKSDQERMEEIQNNKLETLEVCEKNFYKDKILIVDDEPLNVKLLKAKLTSESFSTIEAFNGQECLEKVRTEHPDLILLDIMMPGLNGFEVTRILKADKKTKNIPVIYITALDSSDDKAKALEAGADEFLNKPINTNELLTRIRSILRLRKYQEQLHTRKRSEDHFLFNESSEIKVEKGIMKATILVADTNNNHVDFLKEQLQPYCDRFLVTKSGKEAVQIAESEKIDLVLLDIPLSDMNGHEVCKRLKKMDRTRNIQVITITSISDIQTKIKSIELGTDEYLVKPVNELELQARISSSIKKKSYLDILVSKYETAFNTSITDQLTLLYNHAFFRHYLGLELSRCMEQNHFLSLVMIDIDDFKKVNDVFGHQDGDKILKQVADIIRANVREIDVCARYGGEEFAIVLPYADQRTSERIAERLRAGVANFQEYSIKNGEIEQLTVSIGVAVCPINALNVQDLIHKSDMAMYQAKREGKNRIVHSKDNAIQSVS